MNNTNICYTCLSIDRTLIPVSKLQELIDEIDFWKIIKEDSLICWECHRTMRKFSKFKRKAMEAQTTINQRLIPKTLSTLVKQTKYYYDFQYNYNSDPLNNESKIKVKYENFQKEEESFDTYDINVTIDSHSENDEKNFNVYADTIKVKDRESIKKMENRQVKVKKRVRHKKTDSDDSLTEKVRRKDISNNMLSVNEVQRNNIFINRNKIDIEMSEKDINRNRRGEKIDYTDKLDANLNSEDEIIRKDTSIERNKRYSKNVKKAYSNKNNTSDISDDDETLKDSKSKKKDRRDRKKTDSNINNVNNSDISEDDNDTNNINKLNSDTSEEELLKDIKSERRERKRVDYNNIKCNSDFSDDDSVTGKDINESKKREKIDKETDVYDKFIMVEFTEGEMIRNREEKRSHTNYKKVPYKCDFCVLGFMKKESLDLHMLRKHDETVGSLICDVCQIRFTTNKAVERHRKKHYQCYRCKFCKYETVELYSIANHCRLKHKTDKSNEIHCPQCDVIVKTAEDLAHHIKTDHVLYCNECGAKFKGINTLRRHKRRIHAVKREFTCDICTKTFNSKTRLESHMVTHNAAISQRLSYCAICDIQYKNIYVYRSHLKNSASHSERAYPCPECDKKFASKVYWNKHYNFYHLKKSQYSCEICNKLFISDWRLKNHKQKHHGLTRSRDHACNACGRKFYTLSTLRGHQLTHSEQRTYMCEDCGDTFKQRPALYTHSRLVHRGVKRRKL